MSTSTTSKQHTSNTTNCTSDSPMLAPLRSESILPGAMKDRNDSHETTNLDSCFHSRRSIDWRDSGIVIDDDDDYQYSFKSAEMIDQNQIIPNQRRSNETNRFSIQNTSLEWCSRIAAVQQNHPIVFEQQHQELPPPMHDADGDTMLHLVAADSSAQFSHHLVRICDVNATNNMLQTPLHVAVLANNLDAVKMLSECKETNMHCHDRRGNTPIHLACQLGSLEIVRIILDSITKKKIDNTPSSMGNTIILQCLIGMTNFDGQTCLHLAAINNHPDVLKTLVRDYSADLNSRDSKSGETILHKAINRSNENLVKVILELSDQHSEPSQRHINKTDYSGRSPLDKVNILRESYLDCNAKVELLDRIKSMLIDRIRMCSDLGCRECLPTHEKIVSGIDEGVSSSSSASSDYSDFEEND